MPIEEDEQLARFAVEKTYFRADNTVRHNAFMPASDGTVSVYRQDGLSEEQIQELGRIYVATPRNKPLLGRAVIRVREVLLRQLNVNEAEPPPRHAIIVGWPEAQEKRKEKALELAASATFVRI